MGRIWETGDHTGYFFLIQFLSYDIIHHMGNAWVSQFISHSTGKCNKTHCIRRNWEKLVLILFQQYGCFFFPLYSHPVDYFITWEMHGFPHQFPITQENAAKSIELGEPGNWYPFFPEIMGIFLPSDSHPLVYLTTWEMHDFSQ